MNKAKATDFFPDLDEHHWSLVAPHNYQSYRETEEDLRHEELLKDLETKLNEQANTGSEIQWGDLPFDEESDRRRWEELEKNFDHIFHNAVQNQRFSGNNSACRHD